MSSFKKIRFLLIILISLGVLVSLSQIAWAQDSILPACTSTGDCSLCDILQTAINAGKVILGIIGSLVLLMFVYGGFTWLVSGGNEGNIKKGKDILVNAVIGLGIIFSAYLIVTTLVSVLTAQEFDWQAKLTCVPVSFTPKPPENAVNLTDAMPKPSDADKIGKPCAKTAECGATLYCTKAKICATKLPSGGKIEDPAKFGCKDMEIDGADNLACVDAYCAGFFGGAATTQCIAGQCCVANKKGNGVDSDCDDKAECQSGICFEFAEPPYGDGKDDDGRGKCVSAITVGQECEDANIDRGLAGDDDIPCPPGSKCKDTPGIASISTCQPE